MLRGDVRESDVVAVRNVHPASLFEGKLGFDDTVVQGYDDKELDSSKVPARALAAVRSVVQFTPQYADTPVFPLQLYRSGGHLVSATGQLRWHEADDNSRGFVTIDTPGTKAVVGFAQDLIAELGNVTIEPHSRFGTIYLTARDPRGTIASSRELLVVAVARARNTGMKFSPDGAMMLVRGEAPVLMEPMRSADHRAPLRSTAADRT